VGEKVVPEVDGGGEGGDWGGRKRRKARLRFGTGTDQPFVKAWFRSSVPRYKVTGETTNRRGMEEKQSKSAPVPFIKRAKEMNGRSKK